MLDLLISNDFYTISGILLLAVLVIWESRRFYAVSKEDCPFMGLSLRNEVAEWGQSHKGTVPGSWVLILICAAIMLTALPAAAEENHIYIVCDTVRVGTDGTLFREGWCGLQTDHQLCADGRCSCLEEDSNGTCTKRGFGKYCHPDNGCKFDECSTEYWGKPCPYGISMKDALAMVSEQPDDTHTIILGNTIYVDTALIIGYKNITIDLNGHAVTQHSETMAPYLISVQAENFTIKDDTASKTGFVTGGANIEGNGGGVYIKSGSFKLESGTIGGRYNETEGKCDEAGNKARNNGAGVYVNNGAIFNMVGGAVSCNNATNSGGGVYVDSNAIFNLSGGRIVHNWASTNGEYDPVNYPGRGGGGVYVAAAKSGDSIAGGTFNLRGSAIISDNYREVSGCSDSETCPAENVYLASGEKINITGPVEGSDIGVIMQDRPGQFAVGSDGYTLTAADVAAFKPDEHSKYAVGKNEDGQLYLGDPGYTVIYHAGANDAGVPVNSASGTERITLAAVNFLKKDNKVIKADKGWNTLPDFSGTGYDPGKGYAPADLAFDDENKLHLYADWTDAVAYVTGTDQNYESLKAALDAAEGGDIVTLLAQIDNTTDNVTLIEINKNITLDLNGQTIDLTVDQGARGTLGISTVVTITDSTAGENTPGAGVIQNGGPNVTVGDKAILNMNAGTITKGSAEYGGGVYITLRGTLNLSGNAVITGNTASRAGGGVYVDESGSFSISGSVSVSGSRKEDTPNNVYLPEGKVITLSGPLTDSASVGISMADPGIFTTGYSANNTETPDTWFSSDDPAYAVGLKKDSSGQDEAFLGRLVTVSGITVKDGGKVYDGTTDAVLDMTDVKFNGQTISGLSVTAKGTFSGKNAGEQKTVTISGLTLTGDEAGKYILASSENQTETTGNITAKPVTVTVTVQGRDYIAGDNEVTITGGSVNSADVISGDTVSVDVSRAVGTMADENAGSSKPVTVTGVTLSGTDAGNYSVSEPISASVNIAKKNISSAVITLSEPTTFNFDEQEHSVSVVSVVVDGVILGPDDYEISGDLKETEPDTYTVTVTGKGNYSGSASASWSVVKRSYTVTIIPVGSGTASASPAFGITGTEVTLTAEPDDGWQFVEWRVISGGVTVSGDSFTIGTADVEITAVFEAMADEYYVDSGEGQIHRISIDGDAEFVVKRRDSDDLTYSLFEGIRLDDKDEFVDPENYDAEPGSVIIILHRAFLNTLRPGAHKLTVVFTDGSCDIRFVLTEPDKHENPFRLLSGLDVLPKTGFSTIGSFVLPDRPKDLNYKPLRQTLEIPSLSVRADIVEVPYSDGEYPIAWLNQSVGLLEGSALPGKGVTILTGHNHLSTAEAGPFAMLRWLEKGNRIFISNRDGSLDMFTVFANESIAETDFAGLERIASGEGNTLILITCENEQSSGNYANRRIIAARLIGN